MYVDSMGLEEARAMAADLGRTLRNLESGTPAYEQCEWDYDDVLTHIEALTA